MQASVELQVLVLIAAIAAGAMTTLKFYEDRKIRDIALWLRQRYPEKWEGLPWVVRNADRAGAVEAFRCNPEVDDPELERRYQLARRGRRLQGIMLAVAIAAIAVAVVGYQFFGWTLEQGSP